MNRLLDLLTPIAVAVAFPALPLVLQLLLLLWAFLLIRSVIGGRRAAAVRRHPSSEVGR